MSEKVVSILLPVGLGAFAVYAFITSTIDNSTVDSTDVCSECGSSYGILRDWFYLGDYRYACQGCSR